MADQTILFVKPKAISQRDKKALRNAGVIVVEIDDPNSARLVKAAAELEGSALLRAAAKAINNHSFGGDSVRSLFGQAIAEEILSTSPPEAT